MSHPFPFQPIYLASKSPRRAFLLEQIGVPFEVFLPVDEDEAEALEVEYPNELPLDYVQRVCALKVQHAAQSLAASGLPARPILCADTTVAVGSSILAKPIDGADAERMLRLLSGCTHQVHTAVALMHKGQLLSTCVSSEVTFKSMHDAEIEAYIASGEPFGKAGAYAIQGYGSIFVAHLAGSYSAVMGLPTFEVAHMLLNLD